ncbi:MAG: hypothetical protein P9M15_03665 [Candidatus Electryoneaceae bacterium]|nr:hypothetical protein [Candidatus Electryoneaceae bacterium]
MTCRSNPMNKERLIVAVILALMSFPSLGCTSPDSLTIIVTGSVRGRVDECACPGSLVGGLGRRATVMAEHFPIRTGIAEQSPIGLDCGRFLDIDPQGGRIASQCMIRGLAKFGLKVMGPVPLDLFYGVNFLRSIADSAGVTLVSANLINSASSDLIFQQWAVVTDRLTSTKLAVTSLVKFHSGQRFTGGLDTWTVISPDSVIGDLSASIPEADFIVLLTDMSEFTLMEFLQDVTIFDLVITSSRNVDTASPFSIGRTVVVHPSPDGRTVDGIIISLDDSGVALNERIRWFSYPVSRGISPDETFSPWLDGCLGRRQVGRY